MRKYLVGVYTEDEDLVDIIEVKAKNPEEAQEIAADQYPKTYFTAVENL